MPGDAPVPVTAAGAPAPEGDEELVDAEGQGAVTAMHHPQNLMSVLLKVVQMHE